MSALQGVDRVRVRYHLGYLNVQEASTFQLGVPAALPTLFMVEGAMEKLIPEAVPMVRSLLDRLDCIQEELFGGIDFASYKEIDKIVVNEDRFAELGKYYRLALQSLAGMLGVPPNPYDPREWAAGVSLNVRVNH